MAATTSSGILMVNCNTYSGAEIGIFSVDSYLPFQGFVQFKVIAGLARLYGHTFQPSTIFHDACPLLAGMKMTAVSMDEVTILEHKDYLTAINTVPLMFRQAKHVETLGKAVVDLSGEEDCMASSLHVEIELNETDCKEINRCIQQHSMLNVRAIVVFRELRSKTMEILLKCFPFYCHRKQTSSPSASKRCIKRFVTGDYVTSRKLLEIPPATEKAISSLTYQKDVILMMMGQANTGKSTLARYTVNTLLNQHRRVAFLECDVGQTEFTPSGVVSLTFVSQPLIGPPCTHQRSPERAYFIGDSSPMQQPDLYIYSINSLMQYFISQREAMPLIVNTCGWLKDLGTCIFWDLLRLISPTHVILLHGDRQEAGFQSQWFREELVPIDPVRCYHSLGWLLAPPSSYDQPHPSNCNDQSHPSCSCDHPYPSDVDIQPHPSIEETDREVGNRVRELESPEETEQSTDCEAVPTPETSWMTTANQSKRTFWLTCRRLKLKRLFNRRKGIVTQPKGKAVSKKFLHRAKLRKADFSKELLRARRHAHQEHPTAPQDTGWRRCGMFQLFSHPADPYTTPASSKGLREISMAVYFGQLNNETSGITPWPELLLTAVPYEIKWHQLAVHCLATEVPRSQILYAINGMVVGLTKVDPSIIINHDKCPGMIKFLTERTPLAEYMGYGLVRGVDMKERLFYVTTPEPLQRLEQVNCLMLGKNELSSDVYTCSKKLCNNDKQPYVNSFLPKMAIVKPIRERPI